MAQIYNKYMELLQDENIKRNYIPLLDEVNVLLNDADSYPDYYYLVALHYIHNGDYVMYMDYIFKSFILGSRKGFNSYGYYQESILKDKENAIITFEKAIYYSNSIGAMHNLAKIYKGTDKEIYYLDMAINNNSGEACFTKAMLFDKNNENYNYYLKKGAKFNNCDCIKKILPYYKIKKYNKYKKYLEVLVKYGDKKAIDELCRANITDKNNENLIHKSKEDEMKYYMKTNSDKYHEMLKNESSDVHKLNLAVSYICKNININEIFSMSSELILKNNIYGYLILAYYYLLNNNKDKTLKNLESAKNIDNNNNVVYHLFGIYYERFEKNYELTIKNYLKSVEILSDSCALHYLLDIYKDRNDYDAYIMYLKKCIEHNLFSQFDISNQIDWMKNQSDMGFNIDLLKLNLSIGLINLVKYHGDYKVICRNIDSKIIFNTSYECEICCESVDIHTVLSCLNHKVCLDCIKNINEVCPFCRFDLFDMSRQFLI